MSEPATQYQAIKGEGGEAQLGEGGGEFILPEGGAPRVIPPPPPMPTVVALCPGVECCDLSPFVYAIRRIPPTLSAGGTSSAPLCSTCLNEAFTATIVATGIGPALTWTIDSGALPPGLVFHGGYNETGQVLIDGTPNTGGNYSITVRATSPTGSFVTTVFPFAVFGITSSALPDFTVGDPYFFQLTAAGGSGNYGWTLDSGVLPDGLFFDPIHGIINGTPTGGTGTMPLVFKVVDITCEQFSPVFTPRVGLVTSSVTQIATIIGYPEYIASTPPKKYHTLTWSAADNPSLDGTSEQHAVDFATESHDIAGAKIVWSGFGQIDTHGNQTSNYTKNYFAECVTAPIPGIGTLPIIGDSIGTPPFNLLFGVQGYCWASDPASCSVCDPSLPFVRNIANNSIGDVTIFLDDLSVGHITTPTSITNKSTATFVVDLLWVPPAVRPADFPLSTVNGITGAWVIVRSQSNYMTMLSDEYTDEEALANAVVINSNGRTAENFPRTTGYVNRFTSVNYGLNCSNLVVGAMYKVSVQFVDNNFNKTTLTETFTATSATHVINHNVSQPPAGGTLTVFNPTIAFA